MRCPRTIALICQLLIFLIAVFMMSCAKKNDAVTNPTNGSNVFINSSFEINGHPSLQGWMTSDTALVKFSTDVPSGGGFYSIALDAVWAPPLFVKSIVGGLQGTHLYKFSVWSKSEGAGGWAELILQRPDSNILRKQIHIIDTSWTLYAVLDTMNCAPHDSIVVKLAGGFSQLLAGKTYYDLCKLEKLD